MNRRKRSGGTTHRCKRVTASSWSSHGAKPRPVVLAALAVSRDTLAAPAAGRQCHTCAADFRSGKASPFQLVGFAANSLICATRPGSTGRRFGCRAVPCCARRRRDEGCPENGGSKASKRPDSPGRAGQPFLNAIQVSVSMAVFVTNAFATMRTVWSGPTGSGSVVIVKAAPV